MNPTTICENCGKIYSGETCPKCGGYAENTNNEETQSPSLNEISENRILDTLKNEKKIE